MGDDFFCGTLCWNEVRSVQASLVVFHIIGREVVLRGEEK
jgi:hypothetical protein